METSGRNQEPEWIILSGPLTAQGANSSCFLSGQSKARPQKMCLPKHPTNRYPQRAACMHRPAGCLVGKVLVAVLVSDLPLTGIFSPESGNMMISLSGYPIYLACPALKAGSKKHAPILGGRVADFPRLSLD